MSKTALFNSALFGAFSIALVIGISTPALADRGGEPNSNADGNNGRSDTAGANGVGGGGAIGEGFSSSEPGTVGPFISGEIYGNTSNPSGTGNGVLPSLSPGPWVCNGADCSAQPTEPGGSMGDFLAPVGSDGQGNPEFANGKSPGPDFSEPKKP